MLGWRLVPQSYLNSLECRVRDLECRVSELVDKLVRLAAPEAPKPKPELDPVAALHLKLADYDRLVLDEAARQLGRIERDAESEALLNELGL